MIAGPHQNDRTLIELYADKMSKDPNSAAELFTETAEVHPGGLGASDLKGRQQIHTHLSKAPKTAHRVTAHLERKGDDNYADILTETAGQEPRVQTVRFRTDGHAITKLELVGTRKA